LSFDVSTKLSELQKITALGSNVPLDDKMNVLNTMIDEIRGKFDVLSGLDMKNISKIIKYMGDEMKKASDLQLPDFLTQNGFANEVLDNEARLTLWLAKQSNTYGYMATHGLAKTKLTTNKELADFIRNDPRVLYDTFTLEITLKDWNKVGDDMKLPKNSGKLIDGYEYDAHPQTTQLAIDAANRISRLQQEQKDRDNKNADSANKRLAKEASLLKSKEELEKRKKLKEQEKIEKIEKIEKKEQQRIRLTTLATEIKSAKAYVARVKKSTDKNPTIKNKNELKKANEILDTLVRNKVVSGLISSVFDK
jgi:hypothetical protein